MSQPYVGEVRLVGFSYAPVDWALCNGQIFFIGQADTLFSLIGNTYGGDGISTFAVPDLQGRTPIHQGSSGASSYTPGQKGGAENVTITLATFPSHSHSLMAAAATTGNVNSPANTTVSAGSEVYSTETPNQAMNTNMVSFSGANDASHNNMQPYLVLNWVIALHGIYPSH
jgi:microcystin-dependent protein